VWVAPPLLQTIGLLDLPLHSKDTEDCHLLLQVHCLRAGEMAQRLRAFVALTKDPCSIPSTHHSGSQPSVTPVLGDLIRCLELDKHVVDIQAKHSYT
ncbi:hypothetical protein LEMLEM_LOCUS22193, partial [Lemmus lemmus]